MKRKLFVLAVALTLILFFANGFAKKDDSNLKNLQYTGNGFLRYWDAESSPVCYNDPTIPATGSTINDGESIRIYEYVLYISISRDKVFGSIEISKGSPSWCRGDGTLEFWGEFPIENGQVEGNAISFTVVAEPGPGEYSLFTFYLAENDADFGEFNGNGDLIGGAVQPGENDLDELIYVTLNQVE